MAVYVDPLMEWPRVPKWPYGFVSHMYADDPAELHRFAESIGLKRHWCSDHTQPGSVLLHYDLNPTKRRIAVARGAIEVGHHHAVDGLYYRSRRLRRREIEASRFRRGR